MLTLCTYFPSIHWQFDKLVFSNKCLIWKQQIWFISKWYWVHLVFIHKFDFPTKTACLIAFFMSSVVHHLGKRGFQKSFDLFILFSWSLLQSGIFLAWLHLGEEGWTWTGEIKVSYALKRKEKKKQSQPENKFASCFILFQLNPVMKWFLINYLVLTNVILLSWYLGKNKLRLTVNLCLMC